MRTAPKAGHMTAADQIVTASKKPLDPRAPSTHKHLGEASLSSRAPVRQASIGTQTRDKYERLLAAAKSVPKLNVAVCLAKL